MDEGGCLLIRSTSAVLFNGGSVNIAAAETGHLEPGQPGMAEEQAFLGKSLSSGCAVGLPVIGERGQSRFVILKIRVAMHSREVWFDDQVPTRTLLCKYNNVLVYINCLLPQKKEECYDEDGNVKSYWKNHFDAEDEESLFKIFFRGKIPHNTSEDHPPAYDGEGC